MSQSKSNRENTEASYIKIVYYRFSYLLLLFWKKNTTNVHLQECVYDLPVQSESLSEIP